MAGGVVADVKTNKKEEINMNVLAVNGSPRKNCNTATLLSKALEGAASRDATVEMVHLYDFRYQGCVSCFACKTKGGASYGKCALKDELSPVLARIEEVDIIILGSPIYFARVTGEMRSFMERLWFPYLKYSDPWSSIFPRKINTGIIYTMNITEEEMEDVRLGYSLNANEAIMQLVFGASESLHCYDTYQFTDYAAVVADRFNVEAKDLRRKEVFPKDCEKAFEMGARLAAAS